MTESGDPQLFEIVGGQLRQNALVDLIFPENPLVSFKA